MTRKIILLAVYDINYEDAQWFLNENNLSKFVTFNLKIGTQIKIFELFSVHP